MTAAALPTLFNEETYLVG